MRMKKPSLSPGLWRHYLREWRIKKDMTEEELAWRLGVTAGMISRYERFPQRYMPLERMVKLFKILNCEPSEFFQRPEQAEAIKAALPLFRSAKDRAGARRALEIIQAYDNAKAEGRLPEDMTDAANSG